MIFEATSSSTRAKAASATSRGDVYLGTGMNLGEKPSIVWVAGGMDLPVARGQVMECQVGWGVEVILKWSIT